MKKIKKLYLGFMTAAFILVVFAVFGKPILFASYSGIGEKRFEWDREIYDGVNLRHTMSYNQNKDQKTYTVEFNPKTTALKPIVTTGPNVFGGNVMSSLVNHYESQGDHVVFGVNGDGYDTSNGVPTGIGINDGVLLNSSTSSSSKWGWGITADGEVKYGPANLPMKYTINGQSSTLHHVNKERKTATSGTYLLTERFGPYTNSTEAGVEVVLTVDGGKDLRIGEDFNLTVEKVVDVNANSSRNKTEIGNGKAVLATHKSNTTEYNKLKALTPGTKVKVNVDDNSDKRINWTEIVAGMGIFHLLLVDGVEQSALSNTAIHPRTAMGLKADGSIVLMQNDGRQVGWAAGFSFMEMVEYMRDDLGCVTVFNFDGGGSSTIAATLPGDERATVLNRPSDGRERSNANAFLLVAEKDPIPSKPVEKLHMYPSLEKNFATKGMLLEKTKLSFNVTGTDRNFYPVPITGSNVTYRVENEVGTIGTVNSNGVFTATEGTGKGKVIASYGSLEAAFEIEVVNSISKVERDFTIISVAPGGKSNLEFRALKDGVPIIMSNESLDFQLNPSSLGSISANGVFTATTGQGTGNLNVSYKNFSLSIPVEVGRMPEMILDFEEDIFEDRWVAYYTNMPNNGGSGTISMNYDEDFVKHGDGSLKIDYDFKTNPLKGTVALEIGQPGYTELVGQPSAISAWVYGDGNGGWFRIQLKDGVYAGSVYVNWTGWKYIETAIPEGTEWPYKVQRLVRLLGTPTVANNKKGTIYVDSVRAIYGFQNDDNDAPVVKESSVYPKNGTATADKQQPISLTVSDAQTGINRARTEMYINGKLVDNLQQIVNQDGSVDVIYNPSALTRLDNGKQKIKVRVEDNFGNKTFKEWEFTVTSSALTLIEELPDKDVIEAGESFSYGIKADNANKFTKLDFELSYDQDSLDFVGVEAGSGITVLNENVDQTNGKVSFVLTGMDSVSGDLIDVVSLNFTAKAQIKDSTSIYVTKARVTSDGSEYDVSLPSYDVPLKQKYELKAQGFTPGSVTKFTLTEDGTPISGAEIIVKLDGQVIDVPGITNSDGILTTDLLTNYPLGTRFEVHAVKDGVYSNELNVAILGGSGLVTAVDGAQIRIKTEETEQGLRFTAKLAEDVRGNKHGFYLVFGKTTASELYEAINNQGNENLIINGKQVFVVEVGGVKENGEFSVVLTGIPEMGYLDSLSAIAFVEDAGQRYLVEEPVTRSVIEVALKLHAENFGGKEIESILTKSNSAARKYSLNALGQYEITSGLYETNPVGLEKAFVKDWNEKFGTTFKTLTGKEFHDSAKEGTTDTSGNHGSIKNISNLNIYKFFNDPVYKEKWAWFLDYLLEEDGTTHATRQIEAIKGDGTNGDFLLYNTDHLSYSIVNFFHKSDAKGYYTAINFTQLSRYTRVKNFNFKIFASADEHQILKVGDVIQLPQAPANPKGYAFDYYQIGDAQLQPGANYTVSGPVVIVPTFKSLTYSIKYFDGNEEYTDLSENYTVENNIDLPAVTKDNHVFLGWYDNPLFAGNAISSIASGSTGDKVFYAKFEEVTAGTYTIEYELDGGEFFTGFSTREEMIDAFLKDFHAFLTAKKGYTKDLATFMHGAGKTSGYGGEYNTTGENMFYALYSPNDKSVNASKNFFINQPEYNAKWLPLLEMVHEYMVKVNATQSFWGSTWTGSVRIKEFFQKKAQGGVGASDELFTKIPEEYDKVNIEYSYTDDSDAIILPKATKPGKVFAGWYTAKTGGTKVTSIEKGSTGNKTLYARWE